MCPVRRLVASAATAALAALGAAGCSQKMAEQPSYRTFEPSGFFTDGLSARPLVPGTIPRGVAPGDSLFETGIVDGRPSELFPFPVTRTALERGRERFEIYCSPCHDRLGTGRGIVVRRGFSPPPSLHIDRLRAAPPGHLFDVMTRGHGAMPSYASQVPRSDRWAIAAYIRALQLSQNATFADVPPGMRDPLLRSPAEEGPR